MGASLQTFFRERKYPRLIFTKDSIEFIQNKPSIYMTFSLFLLMLALQNR